MNDISNININSNDFVVMPILLVNKTIESDDGKLHIYSDTLGETKTVNRSYTR